jgi:hypothetical protein
VSDAAGTGNANNAETQQDDTYAAKLRRDEAEEKKARIEAAERSVAKAKETLAAQEKELAKAKKENS